LNKSSIISISFTCLFIALITGCKSTPKTESEQYKDAINSFSYKSLKTLSKNTVNPSIKLYNKKLRKDGHPEIKPELVHAFTSTIFALSNNSKWAIAEANLAIQSSKSEDDKFIAYSAFSTAVHSHGLEKMGEEYAAKARLTQNGKSLHDNSTTRTVVINSILGLSAIKRGDGQSAEVLFRHLANKTGTNWVPVVAHASALLMSDPGISSINKITALAQREDLTLEARQKLEELKLLAQKNQKSPHKIKATVGETASKWTLDLLSIGASETLEATLDIVGQAMTSLH